MALKHNLEKISHRKWENVRDAWLSNIPAFPNIGARPDPGLDKLIPLQSIQLPKADGRPYRLADVEGARRNALWEAIFLFHKCSHANLAAQRLGEGGMHSWCMFNAYHSAYLGAKGIMELLGVTPVSVNGKQTLVDFFPEPSKATKKHKTNVVVASWFNEFQIIQLEHPLDQQGLWEAFQRMIRISTVGCWENKVQEEFKNLQCSKITPPRNAFLYKSHFWPLEDLISDASADNLDILLGTELNVNEIGFLFRLCFSIYRLFEQLISDLGAHSGVIQQEIDNSRIVSNVGLPVLDSYSKFLAQFSVN